ncbi:hypothetical protein GCM10010193_33010 [Kitasatospora atroaurantiaca]
MNLTAPEGIGLTLLDEVDRSRRPSPGVLARRRSTQLVQGKADLTQLLLLRSSELAVPSA